jgi:hypothetical protein
VDTFTFFKFLFTCLFIFGNTGFELRA